MTRRVAAAQGARLTGSGLRGARLAGGKAAVLGAKSKLLLLILLFPITPLLLIAGWIFRPRREAVPVMLRKPKARRRINLGKLIGSRTVIAVLSVLTLLVAGAGVYISYKHLSSTRVTIAAGSSKAESYVMMQALKTVVERHHSNLRITVHETAGTMDSLQRLERGDAQLVAVQADVPASPKANSVAMLYEDTFQLLVHKDQPKKSADPGFPVSGPITQFADLKGKRIAVARTGGPYKAFLFVAGHFGLKESDFTFIGADEDSAIEAFSRNDADANFQVRSIYNPRIARLLNEDAVLLPIDHAAAIHAESPGDIAAVIPRATYQGSPPVPATDINTIATQRLLMARDDADEDAIRTITQVLMEKRQEISNAIPEADKSLRNLVGGVSQPVTRTGLGPAIHPGALAYYDHSRSSFLADHADILCFIAAGFFLFWLWVSELRHTTGQRQKAHAEAYNRKMVELMDEAAGATSERSLPPIEAELKTMMTSAIRDLDNNKLSDLAFQSFNMIWHVAMNTVRDRKLTLAPPVVSAAPGHDHSAAGPSPAEGKVRWSFANLLQSKRS